MTVGIIIIITALFSPVCSVLYCGPIGIQYDIATQYCLLTLNDIYEWFMTHDSIL